MSFEACTTKLPAGLEEWNCSDHTIYSGHRIVYDAPVTPESVGYVESPAGGVFGARDPAATPPAALEEATLLLHYEVTPESLAMLRTVVDVIAPGVDGCPAASVKQVHLRVVQSLEMLQRGSIALLARLLDMYARAERRHARFLDLDAAARERVLRTLAGEELDEVRDLVEALHSFTLDGYLAGWSPDAATREPPEVWSAMGFHGPTLGHLDLVECGDQAPPSARLRDA